MTEKEQKSQGAEGWQLQENLKMQQVLCTFRRRHIQDVAEACSGLGRFLVACACSVHVGGLGGCAACSLVQILESSSGVGAHLVLQLGLSF